MRRNAVSQWELSDHFWAESDPPEPRAGTRSFLQKCIRKFDGLTTDRRVKYRLTGHRPPIEASRKLIDRGDGSRGGHGRQTSDSYNKATIVVNNDNKSVSTLPPSLPPCVIKRADHHYAFASGFCDTESFENFPYHKVSTTD